MERFGHATADDLRTVARKHGVLRLRVFGSWARGDRHPGSDLDLLVRMEPGRTLWDLSRLRDEMEALTGLRIDLATEGGLSPYIRDRVLAEAVPV